MGPPHASNEALALLGGGQLVETGASVCAKKLVRLGRDSALRPSNDPVALYLQSEVGLAPDHPHLGPHLAPERVGDSG